MARERLPEGAQSAGDMRGSDTSLSYELEGGDDLGEKVEGAAYQDDLEGVAKLKLCEHGREPNADANLWG